MIINQSNLSILYQGFRTSFNEGLGLATPQWSAVATQVNSTTREEKYGWLGKVPSYRKWLGDRVINSIALHDYAIVNEPYENTIEVDRDDIEDDRFGVYAPLFRAIGETTAAHPDELVWPHLAGGFTQVGYDGQFFFDTDHPVIDANGVEQSVANTDGGGGTAWYLADLSRALKPIIFQKRRDYDFQRLDKPTDQNVFMRKSFIYGTDARVSVGYGFWQFIWGSKQTLDKANYEIARAALQEMKGDHGRPLGIRPTHLIAPPSLEGKALEIVNSERDAAGATNVWKGTATPMIVPWLA